MSLKKLANKVKKEHKEQNKTFEEQFVGAIDTFLVTPRGEERPQRLAFRPSSYYKCMRQTYYFLKGLRGKGKRNPRSERILAVGTALHEWIQEEVLTEMDKWDGSPLKLLPIEELPAYGEVGIEFITEHASADMEIKFIDKRWTKVFPISAMVDGGLTLYSKDFLFEFKTINPTDFATLIEPLSDHVKQGAIYALCTGVKTVMFLYLCKGTQNLKAYAVTYTQEQLDWVLNRIRTTEDLVLEDILPPKEEGISCRYCEYKTICEKDLKQFEQEK